MSLVAGFAPLDHPYAGTDASVTLIGGLVAVPQMAGHQPRQDRYRLAAHWCEAGPFLPLSWTLSLCMKDIGTCAADTADHLRGAIDAVAGQVELAIRIERRIDPSRTGRSNTSGRDYLRSLQRVQVSCAAVLDRLADLGREARFALALTSRRDNAASGLIRCAVADADRVQQAVRILVGESADLRIDIAGPLPPFGAGVEAVTRAGLARTERPV